MNIKQICKTYNHTLTSLAMRFGIPCRTVQSWSAEERTPPPYILDMMVELLEHDAKSAITQKTLLD